MRGQIIVTSAYPELTDMVCQVANQLSIEVEVVEAVLEDAVERVSSLMGKNPVDVIVSRGATGELLKKKFDVPITSIAPSEFDILQALVTAKELSANIGYFCYPGTNDTEFLQQAQKILHMPIKLYQYRNAAELVMKMENAHREGCDAVVGGGHRGLHLARAYGMEGILIYSSRSTVCSAMEQANEIAGLRNRERANEERQRKTVLTKGFVTHFSFQDLVGSTLQETIRKAESYSKVDITVLIWGESGTGKELFAQSIHAKSHRSTGPFVAINCAALPENLLESELFGYEEGSFTGAKRGGRQGVFELANSGTIFLDEIGKMPREVQSRLLRVLQTKEVRRIGGERVLPVDVRVIAASNEQLAEAVKEGSFRADLYYRLNVLNLRISPVRERAQDIPELVGNILERLSITLGYVPQLSPEFTAAMQKYQWPGNVREMENLLERYAVLAGNGNPLNLRELVLSFPELKINEDTPEKVEMISAKKKETIEVIPGTLEEMEIQLIEAFMQRHGSKKIVLAEKLGISRTTLWKRMQSSGRIYDITH